MNYPILSLPLTGGTRWTEDPHVGETRTEQAVLRYWHGQSSSTANSPAVTSSRWDLLDLAHLLHYLVGPIVGASANGGGQGGTARRDDDGMPVKTSVAQSNMCTSIYELQETKRINKHSERWTMAAWPRRRGWRRGSGELARGAVAYQAPSANTGGCSGLLGWRWSAAVVME